MFSLFLATPEKVLFEGSIQALIAPGIVGYFEILTNHAPIASILKPGCLTIVDLSGNRTMLAVSNGYLEMFKNHATILVETAEFARDIDSKRAEIALDKGNKRLALADGQTELLRVQNAIARAQNRIKVYRDYQKSAPIVSHFEKFEKAE